MQKGTTAPLTLPAGFPLIYMDQKNIIQEKRTGFGAESPSPCAFECERATKTQIELTANTFDTTSTSSEYQF